MGGGQITAGALKSLNNVTSTFFITVHLLLKDLRLERGGARLASCTGRHLTSLRPCVHPIQILQNNVNMLFGNSDKYQDLNFELNCITCNLKPYPHHTDDLCILDDTSI